MGGLDSLGGIAEAGTDPSTLGEGSFVGFGIHLIPGIIFLGGGGVIGVFSAGGDPALTGIAPI